MNVHQANALFFCYQLQRIVLKLMQPGVLGGTLAVVNTDHLYAKGKWVSGHLLALTWGDHSSNRFSWNSDRCFNFRHGRDNLH